MSRLIKIANWSGEKRGNVVFVHGLGGHPYDTWRRRADDGTFWPLWLAHDIKGLAVDSLGYTSPPTNWIGTAMPLLDEAAHALRVLVNSEDLKTGPISFICHSLGGLIVKQVLRSSNEQRNDPQLADFLLRTRQVVFIATPHTGAGKATLIIMRWSTRCLGASSIRTPPTPAFRIAGRRPSGKITSPSPSPGGVTIWSIPKREASYRSWRSSPRPWRKCADIRLNSSRWIGLGSKPFQSLSASLQWVLSHSGCGRGCRC